MTGGSEREANKPRVFTVRGVALTRDAWARVLAIAPASLSRAAKVAGSFEAAIESRLPEAWPKRTTVETRLTPEQMHALALEGLTQEEIGERAGVSASSAKRIVNQFAEERGVPVRWKRALSEIVAERVERGESAEQIAAALGKPVARIQQAIERNEIEARVIELRRSGKKPIAIATEIGKPVVLVQRIITESGEDFEPFDRKGGLSPEEMLARWVAGESLSQIAKSAGISAAYVSKQVRPLVDDETYRRIIARANGRPWAGRRDSVKIEAQERAKRLRAMRDSGMTAAQIAEAEGVSRQRISQILKKEPKE